MTSKDVDNITTENKRLRAIISKTAEYGSAALK